MKFFIILALLFGLVLAGKKGFQETPSPTTEGEGEGEGLADTGEMESTGEGEEAETGGEGENAGEEGSTGEGEEGSTGEGEEGSTGEGEEGSTGEGDETGEVAETSSPVIMSGPTLLTLVQESKTHTILYSLLQTLSDVSTLLQTEGPYTLFAPTDEAFGRVPPEMLDTLKNDADALMYVLSYHVVKGMYRIRDLEKCQMLETSYESKMVLIRRDSSGVSLNDMARTVDKMEDKKTGNGILHAIDYPLMPPSMWECESKMGTQCLLTEGCRLRMNGKCRMTKHVCPRREYMEEMKKSIEASMEASMKASKSMSKSLSKSMSANPSASVAPSEGEGEGEGEGELSPETTGEGEMDYGEGEMDYGEGEGEAETTGEGEGEADTTGEGEVEPEGE
jgi:uncharacterized surface protein with fasciclin (FAS1) repeats